MCIRDSTKRDSLITTPKKKGFFKRLAEVFSPSKQDSAVLVNTSLEVATDTILQPTTSKDSLQQKIRMATEEKRLQRRKTIRRTSTKSVSYTHLDVYKRQDEYGAPHTLFLFRWNR